METLCAILSSYWALLISLFVVHFAKLANCTVPNEIFYFRCLTKISLGLAKISSIAKFSHFARIAKFSQRNAKFSL